MSRIIGLVGNSGAGKSTVAEYLRKKGAYIIDADEISHRVCEPGQEGLKAIKERFGPYFFNDDGTLNRRRMSRVVFTNRTELQRLEDALHPIILKRVQEEIANNSDKDIVVLDCALLIKTGLTRLVDEVWLIKADINIKLRRICNRDNIPVSMAMDRLKNQEPDDELMRHADVILENTGDEAMLLEQVEEYL